LVHSNHVGDIVMFIVMCRVEGGVTRFRESPLTRAQEVVEFETYADAEVEANKHRRLDSRFSYWAEEVASKEDAEKRRI
jgi:hypothetical protein